MFRQPESCSAKRAIYFLFYFSFIARKVSFSLNESSKNIFFCLSMRIFLRVCKVETRKLYCSTSMSEEVKQKKILNRSTRTGVNSKTRQKTNCTIKLQFTHIQPINSSNCMSFLVVEFSSKMRVLKTHVFQISKVLNISKCLW